MSVSPNHARLLTLTARQSDLEYKLTMLMARMQQMSQQEASLTQQKYDALANYLTDNLSKDTTSVVKIGQSEYTTQFDAQLAALKSAQQRLDLQKGQFETQQKAVVAEKESVQKLVDGSVKREFEGFN